jgi:hypothetical protein
MCFFGFSSSQISTVKKNKKIARFTLLGSSIVAKNVKEF